MNNTFRIRATAIAAAMALVALVSTAAAGRPPRPLGAGHQELLPGVHVLDLVSREQHATGPAHLPRIAITLPSGWFNYDGWGINDGGTLIVSFWDVAKVYPTPCGWQGKPKLDPGRTVDGLASTLATRPLRHASKPKAAELDGYRGKYLKWSVPSKIDFVHCGQGYFESWTGTGWASDRYQQGPGQIDRLWILNVKGQRLVIDAAYMPWATQKQRTELNRIVHSIRFLSSSSPKPAAAASGPKTSNVTVSDINDRGQIVGTLRPKGGSTLGLVTRGFVWRKGSLKLLGHGWSNAEAEEINGRGQILGTTDSHGAVLWEKGKTKHIPLAANVGSLEPRALNNRGQVIGRGGGRGGLPALWMSGTVWMLPFTGDWPAAINDRGQVVGEMQNGDVAEWQNGKLTDLGTGYPVAINNHGEILASRNGDVIVWQNGVTTDIGHGSPIAINERGQVIWHSDENPNGQFDTFLWRDGKTTDLGAVMGVAISNSGQVVGATENSDGAEYGFVWQNGTLTRLPAPKGYANFPDRAVAINDHNQIVGDDCRIHRRGCASRFAVLWTLKGPRIQTRQILGPRRPRR